MASALLRHLCGILARLVRRAVGLPNNILGKNYVFLFESNGGVMPVRIKPSNDLGVCTLTLESIKQIAQIVKADFPGAKHSAADGIWEIYDEDVDTFLAAIQDREKLDSIVIVADSTTTASNRHLEIVLNHKEAKIDCVAPQTDENWFEHLLTDIKKHILPPSFAQLMIHTTGKTSFYIGLPPFFTVLIPFGPSAATAYCRILIQQKPPNPFIENIKANLVSNIIWLVLGGIFVLAAQWILRRYGIDINPFD